MALPSVSVVDVTLVSAISSTTCRPAAMETGVVGDEAVISPIRQLILGLGDALDASAIPGNAATDRTAASMAERLLIMESPRSGCVRRKIFAYGRHGSKRLRE
jgi:hypothetical protein